MGGNGSKSSGALEKEELREYGTVYKITENIIVIQNKNGENGIKLPEESHTPNRIYATAGRNGNLKSIAKYDADCLKSYEMHFDHAHDGIYPHYHIWEDKGNGARGPEKKGSGKNAKTKAYPLTPKMQLLANFIKGFFP